MLYKNITEVNLALCRSLGLDPMHVKSINIYAVAGNLPAVTVEYFQLVDEAFIRTVEQYHLVKNEDES